MSPLPARARTAALVAKTLGPGWVVARATYEARKRSGLLRRQLPGMTWDEIPLASWLRDGIDASPDAYAANRRTGAPAFFFDPSDRKTYAPLLRQLDGESDDPIAAADRIVDGTFRYFSHLDVEQGSEPDWHRNALTGEVAPADRHWTTISDFGYGDIKAIWELSRFGWAFDLVRAYWRTGDERYPERFWQLLESFRSENPPNLGPNWKCGQETSLRVMAWCFALYGFRDAGATTPQRVADLAQMIAFSGKRVESTLGYALSQRNNHGVSEGMGLWTIGALFPELRDAARWRKKGRKVLEDLARSLIYDDGGFSQQSTNYHRVMLHDYLWSMRLADILADPFSQVMRDRVGKATDLLYQLQVGENGRVPNYGANDGALIMPLSSSDYSDFRPVVTACRYLFTGMRTFDNGPSDEDLLWVFGPEALDAEKSAPQRRDIATDSGYLTLRSGSGFAFSRVPETFVDRPSHADILAVDLWWRGVNIALDPGTYSYNAPAPWRNGLEGTSVHNTVSVDGQDQMSKAGRFMWAPWLHASGKALKESPEGYFTYVEASHDGYQRLPDPVTHTRAIVRLGDDHWLVLDRLAASAAHDYRLHWLLADGFTQVEAEQGASRFRMESGEHGAYEVIIGALGVDPEIETDRASASTVRGWVSRHYAERLPAVSVSATVNRAEAGFWTLLGPEGARVLVSEDGIDIGVREGSVRLEWQEESIASRIKLIAPDGKLIDALELL